MKSLAPKYKRCSNCSTTRYRLAAKGLCKRCYRLKLRLQNFEKCDLSNPKSLKVFPPSLLPSIRTQELLNGFKADAKEQIKSRLTYLRHREEKLSGKITGIDIEYELRKIARMILLRRGDDLYFGIATLIDHNFSKKQKKLLYSLLSEIDEKIPWGGIHYGKHAAEPLVKFQIEKLKKS